MSFSNLGTTSQISALLTDCLDLIHGSDEKFYRMIYGSPTPQLTERDHVSWAYIDDYGAIFRDPEESGEQTSQDLAQAWGKKTREGFRRLGLPVHKENVADGVPAVLGAEFAGRPYVVGVPRARHLPVFQFLRSGVFDPVDAIAV